MEYIKYGNCGIRRAAADCLAKILQYQYNSASRALLITVIKTDLAESTSCLLRKTFLYFCVSAIDTLTRATFKQHFLASYISMSKDKISTVRMEFAKSIVKLKPFLENDPILGNELMSLLSSMQSDADSEVVEAVEQCDYELLQQRKKNKELEKTFNAAEITLIL